ncbi:MAG: hypothetical protein WA915_05820 [Candidatus Aminicenantaceae bacterium]
MGRLYASPYPQTRKVRLNYMLMALGSPIDETTAELEERLIEIDV